MQLLTSAPIETHFNDSGHGDSTENGWTAAAKERKLSSAHSGSAPSLNTSGETAVLRLVGDTMYCSDGF